MTNTSTNILATASTAGTLAAGAIAKCSEISAQLTQFGYVSDVSALEGALKRHSAELNGIRDARAASQSEFAQRMEAVLTRKAQLLTQLEALRREHEMARLRLDELLAYQEAIGVGDCSFMLNETPQCAFSYLERKATEVGAEMDEAKSKHAEEYVRLLQAVSASVMHKKRLESAEKAVFLVFSALLLLLAK